MEQNKTKYNPFTNPGFLLIFSQTIVAIFAYVFVVYKYGFVREVDLVMSSFLLCAVTWLFWMYHKRGERGSFLVGFIIGIFGGATLLLGLFLYGGVQQDSFLLKFQDEQAQQMFKKLDSCLEHVKLSDYWSGPIHDNIASATPEERNAVMEYTRAFYNCPK